MAELGYALSGIGTGLQQSVGSLRQTAEDLRKENQFEQYQRPALDLNNQQVQEELKLRGTKVTKDEAVSSHPFGQQMWDYGVATGKIDPKTNVITAADKRDISKDIYENNPQLFHSWIQQKSAQAQEQSTKMQASMAENANSIKDIQEKIDAAKAKGTVQGDEEVKKLMPKLQDAQAKDAEFKKQQAAADEQQKALHTQGEVVQNYIQQKQMEKATPAERAESELLKSQGKPYDLAAVQQSLQDKAKKSDKPSSAHLSVPDKTSKTGYRAMLFNPNTGNYDKKGPEIAAPAGAAAQPSTDEVKSLAESLAEGRLAPNVITKRGKSQAAVYSAVKEIYPNFDFSKAQANYNYMTDKTNLKSIGQIKAAMPRVESLEKKAAGLQNLTQVPLLDQPLNKIRDLVGSRAVNDYESLRNSIIQEIGVALTGSSAVTDGKVQLELANLKSSKNYAQLKDSISNLKDALRARTDASLSTPYEWDEVKGIAKAPTTIDTIGTIKGAHGEY